MFTISLRSALAAMVASAICVSAAPGLSLKVSGPATVDGVENLLVSATLANTGTETLKILNNPNGPLRKMPTDTFRIVNEDGSAPQFTGIKVKYVPATALAIGKDDAFTTLAPGASVTITHDLSDAYNFTASGEGKYSVETDALFHYVDETNTLVPLHADVEAHEAVVAGKLAKARPTPTLTKRTTYNGCSSSEKSSLASAAPAASSYVSAAKAYLTTNTASTARYTTWFGTYTSARHSSVLSHYTAMNANDAAYASFEFDCTCTDSDTYAYVYPDEFGTIYLCGAFWEAPLTGTDSKAGTLVHESSHFLDNASTQDYVYGQTAAKSLAKSNPAEAIENADSHEYFAENNPAQS